MVFVVIKHGDGEELLANPYCRAINLINFIKSKCDIYLDESMALDLTDVDGELKGLYKIDDAAAKTVLSFKETYIPVIIDLDDVNPKENARLMLNKDDQISVEILEKWAKTAKSKSKWDRRAKSPSKSVG